MTNSENQDISSKGKWYVAQVRSGQERLVRNFCREFIDSTVMDECFLPEYETMWKHAGEWKPVKKLLFPGYVFLVSNHAEDLAKSLEGAPYSVRLLGAGEDTYTALADGERDWFLSFMDGKHCVRMSEGYIEGDKVIVTRGPLLGLEGDIRKIDRHKRRAYLDATMFGRTLPISVGLEVVRKTSSAA